MLDFAPLLPRTAMALLTLLSIGIMLLTLWRGGARGLVRALATGLLLFALYNPQLRREEHQPLGNVVLVVTDRSDSQKITGRMEETQAIDQRLRERLKALPGVEVKSVASRNTDDADAHGTSLISDMNNALADLPRDRLAGVFLITDGEVHDVPANAKSLSLDVPVHVLMTGRKGEFDRRLELIEAPHFGLVNSERSVKLKVVESGRPPAASTPSITRIRVRREGRGEEARNVLIGEEVELPFPFPHAGQNIFEVELDAVPGELTAVNNRLVLTAEGIRENLRVLLVSGEPHPGERTWRNLLRSDAAVDLVHFTILRPPEKQDGTPINELSLIAFPTRELFSEKLDEFDLVIFDRYKRRGILPLVYLDNVARYVENGGAVLLAAGADFADRMSLATTPLAQIMPAEPTGSVTNEPFRARTTSAGERHPVTRDLPGNGEGGPNWGRWFRLVDTRVSSGDVLMQGPGDKPLLLLDRRAKGRVAMLMSDHGWLWARGYEGGGPYSTLLRRLAHWLMKEPDLEEEFLLATGRGRKLTIERRSMQEQIEPVELVAPTGEKSTIELEQAAPGLWRKIIEADVAGLYRLSSGDLTTTTYVGRINSKELSVVTASDTKLKPVAEATGGAIVWQQNEATPGRAGDPALPSVILAAKGRQMSGPNWLAITDKKAYQVLETRLIPLFDGVIALALLLAALSLTWLREGRS